MCGPGAWWQVRPKGANQLSRKREKKTRNEVEQWAHNKVNVFFYRPYFSC